MASSKATVYKQYNKRDRRAVLETDFSKGMMSTDGVIDEGYVKSLVNFTYEKETGTLTPRPALDLSSLIFLDDVESGSDSFLSDSVTIKATKVCIENSITYDQNILGVLDTDSDTIGNLWVCTSVSDLDKSDIVFSDGSEDTVSFSATVSQPKSHKAYFYKAGDAAIHKVKLSQDSARRIEVPVGAFAFGNSFYFFGEDGEGEPGLFRTAFLAGKYDFEKVAPKELSVSEAVTYGYNMLLGNDTYSFINKHTAATIQFEGILPYAEEINEHGAHLYNTLLMTPKRNQPFDLVCYYDAPLNGKYDIVWEWREVSASDWTVLQKTTEVLSEDTVLSVNHFRPPATEIMVRVSAYRYESVVSGSSTVEEVSDIVEKAMVVGFDFTVEDYGSANAIEQKVYNLTTAQGMASWKGRLVCWGVSEDPTVLFISDYNEPGYFPYPNNITVFNEPIVCAVEFMDMLAVFTTDKLYSVTLSDDGNSFISTVLQSHLHIDSWDRHLVQTVRNMLYFKSGNYYYMMVPKAQTLTGELTLAPITTPITGFFDHFSVNVQELLRSTYGYFGNYSLLTYYNYLDYDDVHNIYVYAFDNAVDILHVDVIYNTNDRTWKVWVYESINILSSYRHDATQRGVLATTSLLNTVDPTGSTAPVYKRVIQLFKWNSLSAVESFLPYNDSIVYYSARGALPEFNDRALKLPFTSAFFDGVTAVVRKPFVFWKTSEDRNTYIQDASSYFHGVDKQSIVDNIKLVYDSNADYYTFPNYQFIDTGYRNDELQYKKRYRELQLQINNLDKNNLDFGMEYILDGSPRKLLYKYDTNQIIDEFDPDYGVVYVDTVPYLEVDLDDIDLSNQWTIDQHLIPDISLWKVRISISGKGSAPRFKLYSRNSKRFELLGINWVSKLMHMR